MGSFYKWDGEDLLLSLYIQPNAKKNEFVGEYNNHLKLRITALPIDNKANKHLTRFLAKTFSVSLSRIELISGANQRSKRFKIHAPVSLPSFINMTSSDD